MIARIFPVLTIGLFLILNHASGQGALTELKKLSETKDLERGSISFYAHELSTSKTILNYNGTKLLIPASNQKLLTTAAALSILGPDYTFKTKYFFAEEVILLYCYEFFMPLHWPTISYYSS